jgi:hypothetical protein
VSKYHIIIRDLINKYTVRDLTAQSVEDLCHEVQLFDRSKYLFFTEQANELDRHPSGTPIAREYPIYNSFRKFGTTMEEKYLFEVTLTKEA